MTNYEFEPISLENSRFNSLSLLSDDDNDKDESILPVRIKFRDGRVYDVLLVKPYIIENYVDGYEKHYLAIPGLIVVDVASIAKLKSIFPDLIEDGFFDGLTPIEGGE